MTRPHALRQLSGEGVELPGPSQASIGKVNAVAASLRQPIAGTGRAPPSRIRLPVHIGPQWRRSTEA